MPPREVQPFESEEERQKRRQQRREEREQQWIRQQEDAELMNLIEETEGEGMAGQGINRPAEGNAEAVVEEPNGVEEEEQPRDG